MTKAPLVEQNADSCPFSKGGTHAEQSQSTNHDSLSIIRALVEKIHPEARKTAIAKARGEKVRRQPSLDEYSRKKALALGALAEISANVVDLTANSPLEQAVVDLASRTDARRNGLFLPALVASNTLLQTMRHHLDATYPNIKRSKLNKLNNACREFLLLKAARGMSNNAYLFAQSDQPALWLLRTGIEGAPTRSVGMIYAAMRAQPALWGRGEEIAAAQQFLLPGQQTMSIGNLLLLLGTLIPQFGIDTQRNFATRSAFNPDFWRFDPKYISINPDATHSLKATLLTEPIHLYQPTPKEVHGFTDNPDEQLDATLAVMATMPFFGPTELHGWYADEPVVGCPITLTKSGYAPGRKLHELAARTLGVALSLPQAEALKPA